MRDFIIIGAGQSGLAIGHLLKKEGYDALIVDGNHKIGAAWLKRWDSLKLFTPSQYNNLPGFDFPAQTNHYPDKYEIANYFQAYVNKFELAVQLNTLVKSVQKTEDYFTLETSHGEMKAKSVIVATGPFHTPFTPSFASKISDDVLQIHAKHYKNPEQLQDGEILVVGAGDSGVQILDEISKTGRKTYFSGSKKIASIPQEILGKTLWWWFQKIGFLSVNKFSWIGKKISKSVQPVIGTDIKEVLSRKNVEELGRSLNADDRGIQFEAKHVSSIKNIVWATGFRPNFSWIKNIELDKDGYPENFRGISNCKNLFFIGLPWMYTRGSATVGGVGTDAQYLVDNIKKNFTSHNNHPINQSKLESNKNE